jgi:NAD-dependent deacetylase
LDSLIERAAGDLLKASYAIALTGAGMSTESGIQDFRGPKGLWTTSKQAEAKAYERYGLFLRDPRAYWMEVLGGEGTHGAFYNDFRRAEPNLGHSALAEIEEMGLLKCVITQNIDGLHRKAGSRNVIEYHGSVHQVRCPTCSCRIPFDEISTEDLPPRCTCGGAMKYDVVHFGEAIPLDFMQRAEAEAYRCDVMLVCGTSSVVYPFAALPRIGRREQQPTTVIEVNAEPTPLTRDGISDYLIQGLTGEILPRLVERLRAGWSRQAFVQPPHAMS